MKLVDPQLLTLSGQVGFASHESSQEESWRSVPRVLLQEYFCVFGCCFGGFQDFWTASVFFILQGAQGNYLTTTVC